MVEKYWNIFFNLICILGCCYQIQNILSSYFKYASVTKVRFSHPESVDYHPLHYCFLCLKDILDIPAIAKKYHLNESDLGTDEKKLELYDIISVSDMLKYTTNDAFAGCTYRSENGNLKILGNSTTCKSFFNIRKYIAQQHVCYEVKANQSKSYDFRQIGTTLQYERVIYEVDFLGKLASSRKIRPILTRWRYPLIEMPYIISYYKQSKDKFLIHVSCNNISTNRLGYPYDDFICQSKDDPVDYFQCLDSCIENHSLETLDRLPYTSFYDSSYPHLDKKLISEMLLKNDTISNMLISWSKKCHRSCHTFPCAYSHCLTTGHAELLGSKIAVKSSIRVEIASAPTSHTEAIPQVPFLDFIIYILSSLGIWFGLVIISCNPIKAIKSYQDYKQSKQVQVTDNRRQNRRDLLLRRMIARSRYYEQYFNGNTLLPQLQ